jgi:hypothetical protein
MLNQIRIFTFVFFALWQIPSMAQEICDNGKDDDGDGLVDLEDFVDCQCSSEPINSLIPNSSFEDTACCPTQFSQMRCAKGWVQASAATSDYFNTCGITSVYNKPPPLPPGGDGYVGYLDVDMEVRRVYKEYIGACLNGTL